MAISAWPSSSRAPYPSMLYFRTHGKGRRSALKICRMERRRLVTRRYCSAQNRLGVMACNTFGWTPAVSINRTAPSLQKLSTLCFAGTACRLNAMSICQMCRGISPNIDELAWESAFRISRWFTRGWTLQELIAPTSVEFFCRESKRIGSKSSLEQQIHEITGIPKSALQGAHLPQFSDKERFSWIQPRQTKVEEDKAYSLLGIFDV